MRCFFIWALISTCLLGVWSQNPQIALLNLWSHSHLTRRQAEGNEKSAAIAKGSGGTFVSSQEGFNEPLPTHQSTNDSSQNGAPNLPLHLFRRQAERNEPNDRLVPQTISEEIHFPFEVFGAHVPKNLIGLGPIHAERNEPNDLPVPQPVSEPAPPLPISNSPKVPTQQFGIRPIHVPTHQFSSPTVYALPSGSEVIVGVIRTTFSCDQRIYGYYADLDNNCQIFHVCVPNQNLDSGLDEMIQYSFFCGNQTVFDQAALVCNYVDDALPCSEAPRLYDEVNSRFGITDRPIR